MMFRTGRQRETKIPDDRRHPGIPHDQRWIRDFDVPRSRVPCPVSQVSRDHALRVSSSSSLIIVLFFPRAAIARARSERTSETFEYRQLDRTRDED